MLVGLTLSNEGHVSIGRDAKRRLREEVYRAASGVFRSDELPALHGRLAYTYAIDPEFVTTLLLKYGFSSIASVGTDRPPLN